MKNEENKMEYRRKRGRGIEEIVLTPNVAIIVISEEEGRENEAEIISEEILPRIFKYDERH